MWEIPPTPLRQRGVGGISESRQLAFGAMQLLIIERPWRTTQSLLIITLSGAMGLKSPSAQTPRPWIPASAGMTVMGAAAYPLGRVGLYLENRKTPGPVARAIAFSPLDPRHSREGGDPEFESGNRLIIIGHLARSGTRSPWVYRPSRPICDCPGPGSQGLSVIPVSVANGLESPSTPAPHRHSRLRGNDGGGACPKAHLVLCLENRKFPARQPGSFNCYPERSEGSKFSGQHRLPTPGFPPSRE